MSNKTHMLEPVTIVRERDHQFKSRVPKKDLTKGQQDLCLHCHDGKHNPRNHHAFPESTNHWGSGGNRMAYQAENSYWQAIYQDLLIKSGLPTGITRVYVEGVFTFGDSFGRRQKPDQENFRYPCSKFLADTMVKGGWIADDSWSSKIDDFQFEFGGLQFRFVDGLYRMELRIFPTLVVAEQDRILERMIVERPGDVEPLSPVVYA